MDSTKTTTPRLFLLVAIFVSSAVSFPASVPTQYQNYLSAQQLTAQYRPQAKGLTAYRPIRPAVYQTQRDREGLQTYAGQQHQVEQPIQQVLRATNVDRQIQRAAHQAAGPYYVQQVQSAQQQGQAQEAIAAAQRKLTSTTLNRQPQPVPVAQIPQQQHQQYLVQTSPQVKYRPANVPAQYRHLYRQQELQEQEQERENPEEYDHNPSYQFGFDVKDDLYTNYQNRKEQREGNKITGSYSVVDSDGFVRTVTYTADPKEGFKAEVTRQPTDIVVKIPKPDPQFQKQYLPNGQRVQYQPQVRPRYQQQHQPQEQEQPQQERQKVVYRYEQE
ncbi:unnamed protein product [Brassicogethes aeneus]|uniref:Uncharacterized protein n=1 Tax=Brassicogethes aeneus TaxID=1431903 RepID=A0A9P0FAC5_BRAAE|nr:unnamed protein product [Brassicogethes aeneus]